MMDVAIIVAIIAGVFGFLSTITTVLSTIFLLRTATRNSAKSDILQMIMEDHQAVQEGRLPTNYQNILFAYEKYHKAGGDEFVTDKKEEYKKWFHAIEKEDK